MSVYLSGRHHLLSLRQRVPYSKGEDLIFVYHLTEYIPNAMQCCQKVRLHIFGIIRRKVYKLHHTDPYVHLVKKTKKT
jgi:hypothetical protein